MHEHRDLGLDAGVYQRREYDAPVARGHLHVLRQPSVIRPGNTHLFARGGAGEAQFVAHMSGAPAQANLLHPVRI